MVKMNLLIYLIFAQYCWGILAQLNLRETWLHRYDFIVVGGGTAGAVVAARLAEDQGKTILLIEAGDESSMDSYIPALTNKLHGTHEDWSYPIVPQTKAYFKYMENKTNISKGKAFGGCSMHNSMNYYRESPEYWQMWTELTGVKNWSYSHVLPYFLKSENNLDESIVANDTELHTTGGPLTITTADYDTILEAYLKASPELGYPITYTDGRQPFGSTIMQRNIKNGVRQTTSLAFLQSNEIQNLHILGKTMATKVLLNKKKRAIGVQFYRNNTFHSVYARKEVILSGGSPGSPHILLNSGIGPKNNLNQYNIAVMSDLNVGEFSYSTGVGLNFDIKDQNSVEKPLENSENYYKYFVERKGPLAYKASGMTCFKDVPDPGNSKVSNGIVLPRLYLVGTDLEAIVKNHKLKEEWRQYYEPYMNRTTLLLFSGLKRFRGTGTIRLISSDPLQYPEIEPCLLCDENDLLDFTKVVKKSIEFFTSPAMSEVIEIFKNPIPGCTPCDGEYFCDSYIRCVVQTNIEAVYPVGGCRIGVANDTKAVVDERLRVFGVSSLRVIDSSIIPLSSDQTFAMTIMIGEYGADLVKEDNDMIDDCIF